MSFFFISVERLKGWAEVTFQISPEKSEPGPGLCHQILYPVNELSPSSQSWLSRIPTTTLDALRVWMLLATLAP